MIDEGAGARGGRSFAAAEPARVRSRARWITTPGQILGLQDVREDSRTGWAGSRTGGARGSLRAQALQDRLGGFQDVGAGLRDRVARRWDVLEAVEISWRAAGVSWRRGGGGGAVACVCGGPARGLEQVREGGRGWRASPGVLHAAPTSLSVPSDRSHDFAALAAPSRTDRSSWTGHWEHRRTTRATRTL